MIEGVNKDGVRCWTPQDARDLDLLRATEGATFSATTFPSGWKSPKDWHVSQGGVLVEVQS